MSQNNFQDGNTPYPVAHKARRFGGKNTYNMKKKAEKKIDLVLMKLQDLYYMGCNDKIINRLNHVLDVARSLQSAIEDESNWQKK